jgi:hypothetical protein
MPAFRRLCIATGAMTLLVPWPGIAQEITVGGEIRPRFEVRHPVERPWTDRETRDFVSMRTRASVLATLPGNVRGFVQLQDVRDWGADPNTMAILATGLNLHQGWIELGHERTAPLSVRVGRQELAYGEERLVGAVNWAQQARSFDGIRARIRPAGGMTIDGIAMPIGNEDVGEPGSNAGLYGVYGVFDMAGVAEGYMLYNSQDIRSPGPPAVSERFTDQITVGGRWASGAAGFTWRVEGAHQTGTRAGRDVSAYLIAGRLGRSLTDWLALDLWYDFLSGDADPTAGTIRVFDTLFATNHKFYGFMDHFTNIPLHTAGRGLQDLVLKGIIGVRPDVDVGVDFHHFRLAAARDLATGHLGEEIDLEARWRYAPGVSVSGGVSYFMPGDAWAEVLGRPDRAHRWGYVMIGLSF